MGRAHPQKGNISPALFAGVGFFALLVLACAISLMSYVAASNYAAMTEAMLKESLNNSRKIVQDAENDIFKLVDVNEDNRNDISKVIILSVEGHYGTDGAKALFLLLNDKKMVKSLKNYDTISQKIDEYRIKLAKSIGNMVEIRKNYVSSLNSVWRGFWLRFAGFPNVDLDEYDPVVFHNGTLSRIGDGEQREISDSDKLVE